MTETLRISPRASNAAKAWRMAEAGMHTLPGAAPERRARRRQPGDDRGAPGASWPRSAHRFIHDPLAVIGLVLFFGMAIAAILTGLFWTLQLHARSPTP